MSCVVCACVCACVYVWRGEGHGRTMRTNVTSAHTRSTAIDGNHNVTRYNNIIITLYICTESIISRSRRRPRGTDREDREGRLDLTGDSRNGWSGLPGDVGIDGSHHWTALNGVAGSIEGGSFRRRFVPSFPGLSGTLHQQPRLFNPALVAPLSGFPAFRTSICMYRILANSRKDISFLNMGIDNFQILASSQKSRSFRV